MIKYRAFKICINIFVLRIFIDSKVYAIKNNLILVLLGIWYSLISMLFGWWGGNIVRPFLGVRRTLEAIHINMTGGIEYDKIMNEVEYDDKTNYIWNNLLRQTTEMINKNELQIIIEIQDEFEKLNKENFEDENIEFLFINLGKINIHRIRREEIQDIFDALKLFLKNKTT